MKQQSNNLAAIASIVKSSPEVFKTFQKLAKDGNIRKLNNEMAKLDSHTAMKTAHDRALKFKDATLKLTESIEDLRKKQQGLRQESEEYARIQLQITQRTKGMMEATKRANEEHAKSIESYQKYQKLNSGLGSAIVGKIGESLDNGVTRVLGLVAGVGAINQALDNVNTSTKSAAISFSNISISETAKELKGVNFSIDQADGKVVKFAKSWANNVNLELKESDGQVQRFGKSLLKVASDYHKRGGNLLGGDGKGAIGRAERLASHSKASSAYLGVDYETMDEHKARLQSAFRLSLEGKEGTKEGAQSDKNVEALNKHAAAVQGISNAFQVGTEDVLGFYEAVNTQSSGTMDEAATSVANMTKGVDELRKTFGSTVITNKEMLKMTHDLVAADTAQAQNIRIKTDLLTKQIEINKQLGMSDPEAKKKAKETVSSATSGNTFAHEKANRSFSDELASIVNSKDEKALSAYIEKNSVGMTEQQKKMFATSARGIFSSGIKSKKQISGTDIHSQLKNSIAGSEASHRRAASTYLEDVIKGTSSADDLKAKLFNINDTFGIGGGMQAVAASGGQDKLDAAYSAYTSAKTNEEKQKALDSLISLSGNITSQKSIEQQHAEAAPRLEEIQRTGEANGGAKDKGLNTLNALKEGAGLLVMGGAGLAGAYGGGKLLGMGWKALRGMSGAPSLVDDAIKQGPNVGKSFLSKLNPKNLLKANGAGALKAMPKFLKRAGSLGALASFIPAILSGKGYMRAGVDAIFSTVGGALGAAGGTFLMPGVGTIAGGIGGSMVASSIGDKISDFFGLEKYEDDTPKPSESTAKASANMTPTSVASSGGIEARFHHQGANSEIYLVIDPNAIGAISKTLMAVT